MSISGPIPPYSNPPIQPQFFEPSRFIIENISLGLTTTVTTTVDHNYVVGQQVRLLIPYGYGSVQLSGLTGYVISIPAANQVVISLSSLNTNQFIDADLFQQPQIIAIGDINSGIISLTGRMVNSTTIPGSFINISPI